MKTFYNNHSQIFRTGKKFVLNCVLSIWNLDFFHWFFSGIVIGIDFFILCITLLLSMTASSSYTWENRLKRPRSKWSNMPISFIVLFLTRIPDLAFYYFMKIYFSGEFEGDISYSFRYIFLCFPFSLEVLFVDSSIILAIACFHNCCWDDFLLWKIIALRKNIYDFWGW